METLCKNCNNPIPGNYCGHCGQSKDTGRLTWSNFFANVAYGFTHINKGFWHTIVVLFRQPGMLYREYLAGKRQAYYRPFSLLVITAALYTVINRIALTYWKPVEVAETVAGKMAENQNMVWILLKGMGEWIINSGTALSALLLLPLYAYAAKRTFRKIQKPNYNLVEYIFVSAYMSSKRLMIMIPLIPLAVYCDVNDIKYYLVFSNSLLFAVTWYDFGNFIGLSARQSLYRTIQIYARIGLYAAIGIVLLMLLAIIIVAIIQLFNGESIKPVWFRSGE